MSRRKSEKRRFDGFQEHFRELYQTGSLEKLDGRKPVAKALQTVKNALRKHCADKPSATEMIVIGHTAFLVLMVNSFQGYILRRAEQFKDGDCPAIENRIFSQFQGYSAMLGKNLDRLGLRPHQMEKIVNLQDYLKTKEGEEMEDG